MEQNFCVKYGLDSTRLPKHVAIIMDGNGRWAKKRLRNRLVGHRAGADSVDKITTFCRELGIRYLTLYAFSTENWNRPAGEVKGLMDILREYLVDKKQLMLDKNIRLNAIGEIHKFPSDLQELLKSTMAETAARDPVKMVLTLALSYGAREEITNSVKKIVEMVESQKMAPREIDEALISRNLYTFDLPDPDLVIRTSGELRLSNYLLWQAAYSELYFTDKLWPDFQEPEMVEALKNFANRERRFGKTTEQLKQESSKR